MLLRITAVFILQSLLGACSAYKVTIFDRDDPGSAVVQRSDYLTNTHLVNNTKGGFIVEASCSEKPVTAGSVVGTAKNAAFTLLATLDKVGNPAAAGITQKVSEIYLDRRCDKKLAQVADRKFNHPADSQTPSEYVVKFYLQYDKKDMAINSAKSAFSIVPHLLTLTLYPTKRTAVHEMHAEIHRTSGETVYEKAVITRTDYYSSFLFPTPIFMSWSKNYRYDWGVFSRRITLNDTLAALMARGNDLAINGGVARHIHEINTAEALRPQAADTIQLKLPGTRATTK